MTAETHPPIAFHRPFIGADARAYAEAVLRGGDLAGNGVYTRRCQQRIAKYVGGRAFLTPSCTAALELAALVLELEPGDEVIMPSWTFPSTANAFALRGAVPVFVDVDHATLNIDPARVEAAVTPRTRAVVCVHYAGVGCDMAALRSLCDGRFVLIEDAAQAYGASWRGRKLGGIGDLGAFSFHGTKIIGSGEGGALVIHRRDHVERAEIAWEKGTNKLRFTRGEIEAYEWTDLGSSFLMSEVSAAVLAAQLQEVEAITAAYRTTWARYRALFLQHDLPDDLVLPHVPAECHHNGHIFFVRVRDASHLLASLQAAGIDARRHYQPLHRSRAGVKFGRACGPMTVTDDAAAGLVRLPLDVLLTREDQERVVAHVMRAVREMDRRVLAD